MTDRWVETTLGEIVDINLGQQLSPDRSNGTRMVPYLRAANVSPGRIDASAVNRMHFSRKEEERHRLVPGDVLLVEGGNENSVGAPALVTEAVAGLCMQNTLLRLRVRNKNAICPQFLFFSMMHLFASGYFADLSTGTTIMHLGARRLPQVPIHLPPLAVQRRIVDLLAHLDNHLANLQTEREAAEASLSLACRVLTDPERNPDRARLKDVCDILDSQRVPINETQRSQRIGDVPYYGANGQVGWIDEALFSEELVLVAEDGGPVSEWRNRPQAYEIDGLAWVNNHAHVLRATSVSHDWLLYSLRHRDLTPYTSGGTRAKLTQKSLREIEIGLPDDETRSCALMRELDTTSTSLTDEISHLGQVRTNLLGSLLLGDLQIPSTYESFQSGAA